MSKNPIPVLALILVIAISGALACAFGEIRPHDPLNRQLSLEDQHKHYTDLMRWSKFQEAASYLSPPDRSEFLSRMPEFEEMRFTDWKADAWEFADPEIMDRALIEVTYRAYSMRHPFEVKIHEQQEWTREGRSNHWSVVSRFEDLGRLTGP